MKLFKLSRILLVATFLLLLLNCADRDISNPFDTACPKEVFTPSNFKAEQQGSVVKLSWVQANTNISGFVINRNENDGAITEVAKVVKTATIWNDNNVVGGKKYGYQILAYAGKNLSNPLQVYITPISSATVTTLSSALNITPNSAVLGGNVTSDGGAAINERGICYSTSTEPTTANNKVPFWSGMGEFSGMVTGLTAGTTYYVRAYAINSQGTAYGVQITFTTTALSLPTVTTADAADIASTRAVLGGNVTSDGNNAVTERGICYSLSQNPTTADFKFAMGSGTSTFSNTVAQLVANSLYYVRAYATNSMGTAYGLQITFKTSPLLFLVTPVIYYVTNDGGSRIFTISSNIDWQVSSDQTWCKPDVNSGSGNGSLIVVYEASVADGQRTATLIFTGAGISNQIVIINQAGKELPSLIITPAYKIVPNASGTTTFDITSNKSWTATIDKTWCTIVNPSGTGNGKITINYDANTTNEQRFANLSVIDLSSKTSIITQLPSPPTEGLLAYYPFNGNAHDESGNGHHGNAYGPVLATDRFGLQNSAYLFNGIDNYINTNINSGIDNKFSIGIWIRSNSANEFTGLLTSRGRLNELSGLIISLGVNIGFYVNSYTFVIETNTNINDDRWHFIVGTYNGTSMKLYIDNTLRGTTSYNGKVSIPSYYKIATDDTGMNLYFKGYIDDILIYNRALTEPEIQQLYIK